MGKVIPPGRMGGGLHQDLWVVLYVSGTVCIDFSIGVMCRDTLHPVGVGEPSLSGDTAYFWPDYSV